MKILFKILLSVLILVNAASANELRVFEFNEVELSQLEVRKVRGADKNTIYTVGSNEKGN